MKDELARMEAYHLIADFEFLRDKADLLGVTEGTGSERYLQAVTDLLAKRQELAKYLALGMAK